MTKKDAPHYSAKHPAGTSSDAAIAAALEDKARESRISCDDAFTIVRELGVTPAEVGKTADLLEVRITKCQLGLFGYSPEKKIVEPAEEVSEELRARIERFTTEGSISCASCWGIADTSGIKRMDVAAACERLQLKISPCQLGAF